MDGQVVTSEEQSFVDSMLVAADLSQQSSGFGDEAAGGMEPQRTIKINHLSFNENGRVDLEASVGLMREYSVLRQLTLSCTCCGALWQCRWGRALNIAAGSARVQSQNIILLVVHETCDES